MIDWQGMVVKAGGFGPAESDFLLSTEEPDGYGGETVLRAAFYEAWADSIGAGAEAEKRYWESYNYWARFASWSTSGGEGTARMMDVNRVLRKIEDLKEERPI